MDYYQDPRHLQLKSHEINKAKRRIAMVAAFAEKQLSSLQSERERLQWRRLSETRTAILLNSICSTAIHTQH